VLEFQENTKRHKNEKKILSLAVTEEIDKEEHNLTSNKEDSPKLRYQNHEALCPAFN
jgi:hypothetical protein